MNKRFFLLFFTLLALPQLLCSQTKRALLVGISDYQSYKIVSGWGNIHGKEDVLLLTDDLLQQGFRLDQLTDAEATYANIIDQLDCLTDRAATGDVVYFHFSGHGQPVLDMNGDEGGNDRWDESIVPYDAPSCYMEGDYEGEHHLIDDLLHEKLLALRQKVGRTGMVYATIDACFSGTVERGDDEEAPRRGTTFGFDFGQDISYDSPIKRQSRYTLEHAENLADLVVLEACLPHQSNIEIKVEDHYYGPLSYHIHQILQRYTIDKNTRWIEAVIQSFKNDRRISNQHIVCESSINHGKGN